MLRAKRLFATLSVTALIGAGVGVPVASAQPQQNGLVNVAVGNINVNVGVGVAANIVAQVCGVNLPVNVLAAQVVQGGQTVTGACTANPAIGPFTIRQVAG